MRHIIGSIEAEYRRYKALAEGALTQLDDEQLGHAGPADGNSAEIIAFHIAGNLLSRFTEFTTEDGEKPWRDREGEFRPRRASRAELLAEWERGWSALFSALEALGDKDLMRTVTIRQTPLSVHDALHRSLAHAAYHVGQIVYLAKALRADGWRWLSIPPGGSAAYNQDPSRERARDHTAALKQSSGKT
jgi:hypothetical protein